LSGVAASPHGVLQSQLIPRASLFPSGYDRGGYGGGGGGRGGGYGGRGGYGGPPPPTERDRYNDFDMHRRGRAYDEMGKRDMPEEYVARDRLNLEDNEVAFVLGRGGSTKMKIARAANCRLDMDDSGHLEFSGPPENCARAREYVELVLAQRKGTCLGSLIGQRTLL
jgi:hypothetical protein